MIQQFDHYTFQEFDPKKGDLFFQLIDQNRSQLEDFFPGTLSENLSLADTQNYCESVVRKITAKSYFPYTIEDDRTGQLIGLVDVKNINWKIPKGELGYFIDQNYAGKGITSKALGLLVDYLVMTYGFKKLLCRVNEENIGSIKVALKNGFTLEGTIRNDHATTSGKVVDLNYYGRIF